jgi:uncharacterized SAM-binding protein YcdF (DUF218 family)
MMFFLKKIVLSLLLPPLGLIISASAGLILARYRARAGKLLTGISLFGLLVLSMPWVAGALIQSLQKFPPIADEQLSKCQAIVVLGGGIYRDAPEFGGDTIGSVSLERLRYALYLSNRSGLPVLATGGAPGGGMAEAVAMRNSAVTDFGRQVQWLEVDSLDTSSSARLSAQLLKNNNIHRVALVSHAWHLPRAVANFETFELTVIPAPMGFSITAANLAAFIPSANALSVSSRALHEWLGITASRLGTI